MHRVRALIIILLGGAGVAVSAIILFSMFKSDSTDSTVEEETPIVMNIATGTLSSGSSLDTTDASSSGDIITKPIIKIAIPERLYNDSFDTFLFDFQESQDIIIKTVFAQELYSYQQILDNEFIENTSIDIALVPSERSDTYQAQGLALEIPPASRGLFHVIFYDLFTDLRATYIPFAIDPLITIIRNGRWDKEQEISLGKLYTRSLANNTRVEQIPLLLGLGPNDRTLLKKGWESYPSQYITLSQLITNIVQQQDEVALQQLIDISNSPLSTAWNYATMRTWTTQQEQTVSGCTTHPIGCLLGQNLGHVAFATLSDITRRSENITSFIASSYTLYTLPHMQDDYPVRLRGRYINKDSQNTKLLGELLNSYMAENQNQTLKTPGLLISPFITNQVQQKKKKEIEFLRDKEYDRKAILGSNRSQTEFVESLGRDFLFEGNIDPTLRLYQKRHLVGK